jgi:hypothetical protein
MDINISGLKILAIIFCGELEGQGASEKSAHGSRRQYCHPMSAPLLQKL